MKTVLRTVLDHIKLTNIHPDTCANFTDDEAFDVIDRMMPRELLERISEAVEGLTTDIDERVNYIDETLNSNGIWR